MDAATVGDATVATVAMVAMVAGRNCRARADDEKKTFARPFFRRSRNSAEGGWRESRENRSGAAERRTRGRTAAKGENPLTGRCGRLSSVCVASVERWAFLGEGEIDNDEVTR
jgi:hypothetical protein